ncbi:Por secretion system C-terminal sorting domain-containing protein [Salinimicrobium catena]|uniref:Por secretion system C-terminal sorting domain-containing protein n=1 Tax=Salinimicrobium catena TaxID=390640 RepID=A0A1H5MA13_9FLAO|nr:T9SS type A sorting domain-containing protein [Salinimicrobium catena]SDL20625.1 Por secretion system C-terminal sorting domain-containing protein [Salinimicrobium catena]SEE86003.1 Por secretion system C-terminal sorting domain-containing protein [Salinimicrobium catena]
MRRFLPLTAVLFISHLCTAQFFVGPSAKKEDHFVYVKNAVLFVADNIHLNKNHSSETEASLYLRKEGQLIQGKEQKTPNTGNGELSVFQTGTAGAYDYDYWAAPVGNSADKNGLFGIGMFHQPQTLTFSKQASHTSGLNGSSNPLNISNRWIYTFSGINYYGWHFVGEETTIKPGYGFSMKGVQGSDATMVDDLPNNPGNAQRYDLRGRPNSGNIEVPIAAEEIVLVGNPYPSGMDLSLFLLENSGSGSLNTSCHGVIERKNATTGIAYFWDSQENGSSHYLEDYIGGYGTFSPVAPCTSGIYEPPIFKSYGSVENSTNEKGKNYDRRFLPVGQGFMVIGAGDENVVFKNAHRVFSPTANSATNKSTNRQQSAKIEVPQVKLQVEINGEYVRGLTLGFWNDASAGTDPGMDAAAYDLAPADVGWLQGEESYVIDVRPFDPEEEIPFFLKVDHENATLKFSAARTKDLQNKNLYILDSQSNTYHSILEDTYEVELPTGNHNNRFMLAFRAKIANAESPVELLLNEEEETVFSIFQNNRLGELEIISDSFSPVRSVALYDLQGKRIFFRTSFGNRRSISISTQHMANALYIVEVTDMRNVRKTKKIAVINPR